MACGLVELSLEISLALILIDRKLETLVRTVKYQNTEGLRPDDQNKGIVKAVFFFFSKFSLRPIYIRERVLLPEKLRSKI